VWLQAVIAVYITPLINQQSDRSRIAVERAGPRCLSKLEKIPSLDQNRPALRRWWLVAFSLYWVATFVLEVVYVRLKVRDPWNFLEDQIEYLLSKIPAKARADGSDEKT
jgi:hypothetical protein